MVPGGCLPPQNQGGRVLLGALVCQISLLESTCQGLGGISGQAPDPRAKLLTLQGYLRHLLAWAAQRDAACFLVLFHGEPTVLTPGALPWSPWLLWEMWLLILPASSSLHSLRNYQPWENRPVCPILPCTCKPPLILGKFL